MMTTLEFGKSPKRTHISIVYYAIKSHSASHRIALNVQPRNKNEKKTQTNTHTLNRQNYIIYFHSTLS